MQIGLGTLLFVVFLILKLTGYIAWSWFWVTSPLWISFLLIFLIIGVAAIVVTKAQTPSSNPYIR